MPTYDEIAAILMHDIHITAPGTYAHRALEGRVMIWASEDESAGDDDGQRAVYRSRGPVTDEVWVRITKLAWVDGYDSDK